MTQPMEPQTFVEFCNTLNAALPSPRLIVGKDYLSAAWMNCGIHWELGANPVEDEIEVRIESALSTTKLGRITQAADVITMLRALRAIEAPAQEEVTTQDKASEHLAVMGATADLYASVNHYLTWAPKPPSSADRVHLEKIRDRLLAIGFGEEGVRALTRPRTLAQLLTAIEQHDTDYDTRYGLVLDALARANHDGLTVGLGIDHNSGPDTDGRRIVAYIELPDVGQVSWHLPEHNQLWDGHTTPEKYQRIHAYTQTEPVRLHDNPTPTNNPPMIDLERCLDTLRRGLTNQGLYLPHDASDEAVVTLALDVAKAWERERQRVERMAHQRGRILGLCNRAEEVVPWKIDGPPKAWTLDPAAVREALMYQPAEATGPMSRKEEILRAVLWQFEQVQAEVPDEFDAEDRAMIQFVRCAVNDLEAPWTIALLELIGGGLDDMASDEVDELLAKWRAATQEIPMPADVVEKVESLLADPSTEASGGNPGESDRG